MFWNVFESFGIKNGVKQLVKQLVEQPGPAIKGPRASTATAGAGFLER